VSILAMKQPQGRPDWRHYWGEQERSSQVGVCIDGDGISHKYIDSILAEATTLGSLLVPRVFGNWDLPALQGWQRLLIPYRLERRHHHLVAPGKNATDIALVIDVLELLYQHRVRQFCLVVADSDYTPLVSHLRSVGCTVLGLGLMKTSPALQKECTRFVALDQPEAPMDLASEQRKESSPVGPLVEKPSLETMVITAYDHLVSGNAWVSIPDLEEWLKTHYPWFCPKDYGHRNLSRLVKARFSALFDVRSRPLQQNRQELRRNEQLIEGGEKLF
jgi:uncharacterized LabA/DUF88 family protein